MSYYVEQMGRVIPEIIREIITVSRRRGEQVTADYSAELARDLAEIADSVDGRVFVGRDEDSKGSYKWSVRLEEEEQS